ncbi:unnamed protein product, partial [Iphiclides podalirius]
MLLVLVVCHLVGAIIANPLNKYPFVFLLDVGNEELEKTNTEQVRLSIPGGSLAVRYPAVGEGDLITHVRVTGIDYGTDLKANIVDGGPGYKYVVLVFFGNTGVPYETVLTLQTQSNANMDSESVSNKISDSSYQSNNQVDENNSAEDTDDSADTSNNISEGELVQSSDNVYNYAQASGNDHDDPGESANLNDSHIDSVEDDEDPDETGVMESPKNDEEEEYQYKAEKLQARSNEEYAYNSKYENNALDEDELGQGVPLDQDARMYRQEILYDNTYSAEDPVELDQMFNDEEVHNDADKFRDSNNNNFDSDYDSAVAY